MSFIKSQNCTFRRQVRIVWNFGLVYDGGEIVENQYCSLQGQSFMAGIAS